MSSRIPALLLAAAISSPIAAQEGFIPAERLQVNIDDRIQYVVRTPLKEGMPRIGAWMRSGTSSTTHIFNHRTTPSTMITRRVLLAAGASLLACPSFGQDTQEYLEGMLAACDAPHAAGIRWDPDGHEYLRSIEKQREDASNPSFLEYYRKILEHPFWKEQVAILLSPLTIDDSRSPGAYLNMIMDMASIQYRTQGPGVARTTFPVHHFGREDKQIIFIHRGFLGADPAVQRAYLQHEVRHTAQHASGIHRGKVAVTRRDYCRINPAAFGWMVEVDAYAHQYEMTSGMVRDHPARVESSKQFLGENNLPSPLRYPPLQEAHEKEVCRAFVQELRPLIAQAREGEQLRREDDLLGGK